MEPEPHRWEHVVIEAPNDPDLTVYGWQQAASGYARRLGNRKHA